MISDRGMTRRILVDRMGTALAVGAVITALIPLGAMTAYVIAQGGSALSLSFFTQGPPAVEGQAIGGMFPMIVGSLILIGLTSCLGIPVGLLSGIYLWRYGAGSFGQAVRFVTDVIAGIPSILAGVIAFALVVLPTGTYSAYSAAIALALLMFPTVTRATETALGAVPTELREAALGLGATEWRVVVRVVVPTAASGIVTAVVLGIARVTGETAPLVFTANGLPVVSTNIFGPMGALPLQIWQDANTPFATDHQAAFAGALVLFGIILALNLIARILTYRLSRRTRIT